MNVSSPELIAILLIDVYGCRLLSHVLLTSRFILVDNIVNGYQHFWNGTSTGIRWEHPCSHLNMPWLESVDARVSRRIAKRRLRSGNALTREKHDRNPRCLPYNSGLQVSMPYHGSFIDNTGRTFRA
jgi:hypothetical protein